MRPIRKLVIVAAMATALITAMGVETASGTVLYRDTGVIDDMLGKGTMIEASLSPETTAGLRFTDGKQGSLCTSSEIAVELEEAGGKSGHPRGKVSALTFSDCTTVFGNENPLSSGAGGKLEVQHTSGTDGTVVWSGFEVFWTTGELKLVCKPREGGGLGLLTGATSEGHATLEIDAVVSCGFVFPSFRLVGTYTVTNPTGLIVEAE